MIQLPDSLNAFLQSLRITDDYSLWINEQPYPCEINSKEQLAANLSSCLYHLVYTRNNQWSNNTATTREDLTPMIARANRTPTKIERDWKLIENLDNGSVIAERNGKRRQFRPGEFFVADSDFPIPLGSKLITHRPGGSSTQQPGFYYCFSEGIQDINDRSPIVRIYWNVRPEQVGHFVHLLTGALNRYEIPFNFKVTTQSTDFDRADNAVLYIAQRWFYVVALALESILPAISLALDPATPLFTKQLAAGIGLAEDPGHNESFGTSRCKLIAHAILASLDGPGKIQLTHFTQHFLDVIAAAGLNPEQLYLNAGSQDTYTFNTITQEQVA